MKKSSFALVLACTIFSVGAQSLDILKVEVLPSASVPLGDSGRLFSPGPGLGSNLLYDSLDILKPGISTGWYSIPSPAGVNLDILRLGLLVGADFQPSTNLGFMTSLEGGIYQASWKELVSSSWYGRGNVELRYRFLPSLALLGSVSYAFHGGQSRALLTALEAGFGFSFSFAGLSNRPQVERVKSTTSPLFPALYSQYDRNTFGSITISNREDGDMENVSVSFFSRQYMERPREALKIPRLARNQSIDIPLYALFTADLLKLTESTTILGEVQVDYDFLGQPRHIAFAEEVKVHNRNAMNWDDDRKAAAFISSKDPAVLRYSKYVAGLVRDQLQPGLDSNLQLAMGLFENIRTLGINYVVDPTTPYASLSETKDAIDYLQFPFQTLVYRGGDCDDLSILFTSILESVGIETALITIPGHIFTAFKLEASPSEARQIFGNDSDFLVIDGEAWIPVEATIPGEGFIKAWQTGLNQYTKAGKTSAFLKVHDAWKEYNPVGVVSEEARMALPTTAEVKANVQTVFKRFADLALGDRVRTLRAEIESSGEPRLMNRLGVLYARFGKLSEAKLEFERAIKAGYQPALVNVANIAQLQKDLPLARTLFERALKERPGDPTALLALSRIHAELNNKTEAERYFRELEKVSPELASSYAGIVNTGAGRQALADNPSLIFVLDGE